MNARVVAKSVSLVLLLAATAWLATERNWESFIAFSTALSALIAAEGHDQKNRGTAANRRMGVGKQLTPGDCKVGDVVEWDLKLSKILNSSRTLPRPNARHTPDLLVEHLKTADALFEHLRRQRQSIPLAELDDERLNGRFHGFEVNWAMTVMSVVAVGDGSFRILGHCGMRTVYVFDVKPSTSPDVEFIRSDSAILVSGVISNISGIDLTLWRGQIRHSADKLLPIDQPNTE